MVLIEAISNMPRIHRFWIRWPAPGISHAMAGAITDMLGNPCWAGVFGASAVVDLAEFAIQIITISL
jgi:hypothetical protein